MDAVLDAKLSNVRRLVEAAIERLLPSGPETPDVLVRGMRYAVVPGGKRLRPVLCLLACEACGGESEKALACACALEFVHAFSLVHDDLPAMDDDDLRRGRPTLHKVIGEGQAILAGDALLTLAFDVIVNDERLSDAQQAAAVRELAWAGGHAALAGGQALDLEAEGKRISAEDLDRIHAGKTAALITASVVMGGIAAGAMPKELDALRAYGRNLGLAFQIIDDVLDVVGDEAKLGKHVGADAEHDKATAVAVYGLDEARRRAADHVQSAREALQPLGERGALLAAVAAGMLERDR
ncbi:MAG: polyprenyl synthetase family protein [Verrucomicrobia bacterium]|nr:polyprenyl synthetase family protein [Verrucomicrobiota bacterium]